MENGAVVVAGSDAPVVTANPLEGIEVERTRREVGVAGGPTLNDEQRVDLPRIIAAYTTGSAYANFLDRESGSIEVGKWADFVVLDKNLFELPAHEIHAAKVLWTVVEGRDVFRSATWP